MLEEKNEIVDQKVENQVITAVSTETITDKLNADQTIVSDENQRAIDQIDSSNAEESEDETLSERHDIPMLDYQKMSMEELTSEFEKLVNTGKISSIREHIEAIRSEFLAKYNDFFEEKKGLYALENEGSTLGFDYHFPLKQKFDSIFKEYKERRNEHYKQLEISLKNNLNKRLEIIEELKNLLNVEANIPDLFKRFNEIREHWKSAGPIPKDRYNHVWNTYHFHVENFYDFIHLDQEARDLDFKYNLEQKQKVIERAKELLNQPNINTAIRELQLLHKLWKEELGPVDREHREKIWNEFREITRQIHEKRDQYFQSLRVQEEENLVKKQEIIEKIRNLIQDEMFFGKQWNEQYNKLEVLRTEFLSIGEVVPEKRNETWKAFREATGEFFLKRKTFYKTIDSEHKENLSKKRALLKKASELKDSDDFETTTPIMKQIQKEWKTIGRIPKKHADEVWLAFNNACNHYFNRLHAKHQADKEIDLEAYNKKVDYLKSLENVELSGEHKADLELIKSHIETWKNIGKVPYDKRDTEDNFHKIISGLFSKLDMDKQEAEKIKYSVRLDNLVNAEGMKKLDSERFFLSNKVEKIQNEILQLENNLMFFRGVKDDNPMLVEVKKNIEKQKQELQGFKDRLRQLHQVIQKNS